MRGVIITLSGDAAMAEQQLAAEFEGLEPVHVGRELLEKGSPMDRVRSLRSLRPHLFCVVTESIEWQYGQEPLILFGALGGARESIILDRRGRQRRRSRLSALALCPFSIAAAMVKGKLALARAGKFIRGYDSSPQKAPVRHSDTNSIVYLRATPAAGTQPGGATSHINGVVNALLELGSEMTFVSNDDIAGLDTSKVHFRKIGPDPDVIPRAAFDVHNGMRFSDGAVQEVAAKPPALIYQRYCRFSWAGVEASRRTGVPLFLEYNGSEVWIGKNWDRTEQLDLLERCENINLASATRIFVISEVERRNLLARGVPDEKVIINPNGVDPQRFRPDIGGAEERESLGIASAEIVVGFVGTFGPWHGVLALADAIAGVSAELPVRFLLIGDGSLRAEVEKRLAVTGDLHRVTFTGVVAHDRVPVLLDACDILVSPHVPLEDGSEFFGSPTKLFEYMAMAKPIVASRLGQIGDVLTHLETALLVEPANVAQLAEAITRLSTDPVLREKLGRAAREAVIANHTWTVNARRVLEAYKGLG